MSVQLESRHFYQAGDIVRHRDGASGTIVEGHTLFALVRWEDGRREEVDQFDPRVLVVRRSEAA